MQVLTNRLSSTLVVMLLAAGASFALACGGGSEGLTEPTTGNLEVSAVTTGDSPDPDGYTLSVDGAAGEAIEVGGTVVKSGLSPGNHTAQLSGLDGNCVVEGANPRTVAVVAGQTVKIAFAVTCTAAQGSLAVTTTTTGALSDPDGYTVTLDGVASQSVGVNATYTFVGVVPGPHSVELTGLADPCRVDGDNPQSVTVAAGVQAQSAFAIVCTAQVISLWSKMTSGTTIPLYAVWGSSPQNVFSVGYHFLDDVGMISESVILRSDGTSWAEMPDDSNLLQQLWLTGVSGSSSNDVFAVGEGFDESGGSSFGGILHYDGTSWSRMDGPALAPELDAALYSVSSSSPDEAYAVGFTFNIVDGEENATALRYDGSAWASTTVPGSNHLVLRDIWSRTGAGAFAVGDDATSASSPKGAALRWDGTKWGALTGAGNNSLNAVWGSSAVDVFAVGDGGTIRHFDGTTLSAMTSPTSEALVDVYGNGSKDVYAVGLSGTIVHYDGTSWKVINSGVSDGLFGVWTTAAEAFAVGDAGRIIHGVSAPVLDIQPDLAAQRRAMVRRDIGREALDRKWPFPGRRGH